MSGRARFSWARAGGWLIGGLLLIGLAGLIGHTVPVGVDFGNTFYAVGRAIWSGQSPYSVRSFLSPPWVLPLIAPLGILPLQWAWGIFTTIGLGAYLIAFVRMRLKPIVLALLMLSPFVWFNLYYGNIDWLILLGATLPPQWGIWLLVIKPQMSAVLIALWAYRLWRKRGAAEEIWLANSRWIAVIHVGCMEYARFDAAGVVSFSPLLANYVGPLAWHFGSLIDLTTWLELYLQRRKQVRLLMNAVSLSATN